MPPSNPLLEYFMQKTDQDLELIKEKLDDLSSFRWKLVGASITLSMLFSAIITIVFGHK